MSDISAPRQNSDKEPRSQFQSIPSLTEFGLTPLQEKIFVSLVGKGGLSTTEISRSRGVHRSDVYRSLRKLIEIGLVEAAVGSPSRYYAIEPMKAVRLLLEEKRKQLLSLESKTDAVTEWLERERESLDSAFLVRADEETATFRLVKGNSVTQKVIESIQSSETEIIKVVSAQALRRHYFEFCEYEKQATARNVTVRVLTEVKPQNLPIAQSYCKSVHLRHVANLDKSLRYSVIDGTELVLAGTVEFGNELDRSVLTTKNSVLVRGCISYFEDMWAKSLSIDERTQLITNTNKSNHPEVDGKSRTRQFSRHLRD